MTAPAKWLLENNPMALARREYAFMLRLEGLTYREIGARLGVSKTRALQLARIYAMNYLTRPMLIMMRRTKFIITEE